MSVSGVHYSNYFSVEDILATQERLPCKFIQDIPELGKLDQSSQTDDLKAGTEMELPLWLVQSISTFRPPVAETHLPKIYTEAYREILKADPTCVDLHRLSTNFYELGCYINKFDPKREIGETLIHTYQHRFRVILDLCEETHIDPTVIEKLDKLEGRLYKEAHDARIKLNKWLVESKMTMEPAKMILNHKKRKRIHMEV